MIDQRINCAVYVKVLSELMKILLDVSSGEEMGYRTRQRKKSVGLLRVHLAL